MEIIQKKENQNELILKNGKYYLYRWMRKDKNQPFYIGIGTKKNLNSLSYERANNIYRRSTIFKFILNKTSCYYEIILESNNREFIKQKEIEFIKLYGRRDLNLGFLVNMTDGGDGAFGVKHSLERRLKNSERCKGRIMSIETRNKISKFQKGKILSEETRNKISKSHIGIKPNLETRKKMSIKQKGKFVSEETKNKISNSLKGKTKSSYQRSGKVVLQYDLHENLIREWKDIKSASQELSILRSSISNNLKKRTKKAGGFIWKYKIN